MKYLKYKPQSIFPMWGRVKLNFRDRYEKPNIYSKNSSCCQVFFRGLSKNDFGIMGTPHVMPPLHWMPPMMGGPFGRHAFMWLFHLFNFIFHFFPVLIFPNIFSLLHSYVDVPSCSAFSSFLLNFNKFNFFY